MAVEPVDALEAVAHEACRPVLHRRDHGRGPERDRSRETQMMLRLADIEGRPDQDVRIVRRRAMRDDLRAQRVGAEEPVRPMLLGRADGDDDALRVLEISIDLGPG
jgi:hypothetical protein